MFRLTPVDKPASVCIWNSTPENLLTPGSEDTFP
jgi:hypothetical protein